MGIPACVIPSPGTDFSITRAFKAVNPPTGPSAPQSIVDKASAVPYP